MHTSLLGEHGDTNNMPNEKNLNIYDIAKLANVSIATVSRVINKKGNVTPKTQKLVEQAIREHNYRPNVFARGLGLGTMKVIGVLCASVTDIYYAKAVSIIEKELREMEYDVILSCTGNAKRDRLKAMESLLSKHVDAIILIGSVFKETDDNTHLERIAKSVPIILINGSLNIENVYCVFCEEEEAMWSVVNAFVGLGRRDILYLEAPGTWSSISKQAGYRRGLADHGIPWRPELILDTAKEPKQIAECLEKFLLSGIPVSAICCSEDIFAVIAIHTMMRYGMRIPEDISVVGFNNSMLCDCCAVPLASIDNRVEDLSRLAVSHLLDIFSGTPPPTKTVLPFRFIVRDSLWDPHAAETDGSVIVCRE